MTSSSMAFQSEASSSSSSSSSSLSSSTHLWNHDVFLSFRGEDVRYGFISHLHQGLNQRGIKTYIDSINLERGEEISPVLCKAIEESIISIIVLSKNYAESRWCLDELLKILDCKETIALPIFYHVDPSEVRHQKGIFGESFDKLGDKLKDNAKMLKWKVALKRVADLSGFTLAKCRKESEFILEIIQWVDLKMVNQTPLSVAKYPIGIESRIQDIYQHLSIGNKDIISIVGIFGTGGIGKTTISKDIYNRISSQFEGSCFLEEVRETSKQLGGLMKLQNTLLYDILGTSLDVHDKNRGINVIRDRLHSKRILLILDDVDELVQLENLVGDRDWFGSGSRIIITTRDQHLLEVFEVDLKYEVMILDDNEALQLFSLHAFKEKEPLKDFMDISKQVTKYAQGLPLALTVLGSDLKSQSIKHWKSAMDKYKNIPHSDIQKVLLVSYAGLHDADKEIFLDIAFFFKGESLENVTKIFDSCGFYPNHGIERLKDKCLITIEGQNKRVGMHDLLQAMGREIVRQESPKKPSKRSRLWNHEDIHKVLQDSTGPNKIEGIVLDLPKDEEEIRLHPKAFLHMKRLRVFINRNARFSCGSNYLSDNYLSEELRVLDWNNYPSPYLPRNFQGKKLIVFRMQHSLIKKLGDGFKPKNLTSITFEDCKFLKKIPDLSILSNLKELAIQFYTRLVEVHDSIGSLENLSMLEFFHCSKLQILPRSLNLRSLCYLGLQDCPSIRYLPEIECKMESLIELNLRDTAIEELPLSIGNLVRLESLYLRGCKNLMRLPIACIQLQHLRWLEIDGNFPNLVKKMRDDGLSLMTIESTKMEEEMSLREERLHELASPTNSSNGSTALQLLNLQNCFQSETHFYPISSLFTMFNSSASLCQLYPLPTDIVCVLTSIKDIMSLESLSLSYCCKLEEIPELPPNIREVDVRGCKSIEMFREELKILELNGSCYKLHENRWNDKVQDPLLWKGVYEYDATLFLENQIPKWLSYTHEFLKGNGMVKGPDNYVKPRGEEDWVINIKGPHNLEEINGIVLYITIFLKMLQWMVQLIILMLR
ncbi:disease resistance protein RUN1-like isoform X2 [Carya illinoinensis]|uniref:disease resistance protein RUN1-like isoform X2 n=1 Tax=Carya illinoinensis TaxID=32201 RepID=UPI001C719FA2|nr:disease resistance protein RUN1-like isoform X2 [Carya illinoinensis]